MAPPTHRGTDAPHGEITTVWTQCPTGLYPNPHQTATQFYGTLFAIAILVVALWVYVVKKTQPKESE